MASTYDMNLWSAKIRDEGGCSWNLLLILPYLTSHILTLWVRQRSTWEVLIALLRVPCTWLRRWCRRPSRPSSWWRRRCRCGGVSVRPCSGSRGCPSTSCSGCTLCRRTSWGCRTRRGYGITNHEFVLLVVSLGRFWRARPEVRIRNRTGADRRDSSTLAISVRTFDANSRSRSARLWTRRRFAEAVEQTRFPCIHSFIILLLYLTSIWRFNK